MGLVIFYAMSSVSLEEQQFNLQVGATGDDASIGNTGVRAEIRTHAYDLSHGDVSDSFWVGDDLVNGAFIQFGFELHQSGYYCLGGEIRIGLMNTCTSVGDSIGNGDARWFWQYWPNSTEETFYFGIGPLGSAGDEGSWHSYSISSNSANGWTFLFDDRQVDSLMFQSVVSQLPAYVVAEKVSNSTVPGPLGPVQFRNIAFLKKDGWHPVDALYALVGCGMNVQCVGLKVPQSYGVSSSADGNILVGSGVPQPKNADLIWSGEVTQQLNTPDSNLTVIEALALTIALLAITAVILRRLRSESKPNTHNSSLVTIIE